MTYIGHYAIFRINDLIRTNSNLVYHWQIIVNGSNRIEYMHVISGHITNLFSGTINLMLKVSGVNAQSQGNGDTQPSRVGSHDQQTSPNGANAGGTVTDPTITGDPNVVDSGDTVKADCFGKVISFRAQEHKENPDEGTLGSHASDPVPELPGNETPRR